MKCNDVTGVILRRPRVGKGGGGGVYLRAGLAEKVKLEAILARAEPLWLNKFDFLFGNNSWFAR